MLEKKLKIIITFASTTQAMEMENACHEKGVPGRLIPMPLEISAGCGMVWCMRIEEENEIKKLQGTIEIKQKQLHKCMV